MCLSHSKWFQQQFSLPFDVVLKDNSGYFWHVQRAIQVVKQIMMEFSIFGKNSLLVECMHMHSYWASDFTHFSRIFGNTGLRKQPTSMYHMHIYWASDLNALIKFFGNTEFCQNSLLIIRFGSCSKLRDADSSWTLLKMFWSCFGRPGRVRTDLA